jgi:hypothetical protein
MEISLHLPEQKFTDTPTKTQLSNLLGDLIKFQTRLGGFLLAREDYAITDPSLATLLNATVKLKAAKDLFDGVSTANMPQPTGGPQRVPSVR